MTKKQSNIIQSSTHLKEDCQVLLFRFKNEFGKEKSLVDLKGRRLYPEFYPKDFTPRCTWACNSSLDHIKVLPLFYQAPVSASAEMPGYSIKFHQHP